jgi:hypothetical protein
MIKQDEVFYQVLDNSMPKTSPSAVSVEPASPVKDR